MTGLQQKQQPTIWTLTSDDMKPGQLRQLLAERMPMLEAVKSVVTMLRSFPSTEPDKPSYIDALGHALTLYPAFVARGCADMDRGLITEVMFKPTVANIHDWCRNRQKPWWDLHYRFENDATTNNMAAICKSDEQIAYERQMRESIDELRNRHGQNWGIKGFDPVDRVRYGGNEADADDRVRVAQEAIKARDAERTKAQYEQFAVAEYERLGIEPIYSASGMIIHPDMARSMGKLPEPKPKPKAKRKTKAAA